MENNFSPEVVEEADKFFRGTAQFVSAAPNVEALPNPRLPEFAFAGRSNVGKSSLLNALCSRQGLARTSNTPGRTQTINFFSLNDRLLLVDLPGYGYAKAAKSKIAEWGKVVELYLKGRVPLKRVFVLVDSRHGFKPVDYWVMELLDGAAQSYQIVLTKTDKTSATALKALCEDILIKLKKHPAAHPELLTTSSSKKLGLESLRSEIFALI